MVNKPIDTAAARLQTLARQNPHLAEVVDYYRFLVPALFAAVDQIQLRRHLLPGLTPDVIAEKLGAGTALLVDEEFSIDPNDCREVFRSISRAARDGFQTSSKDPSHRFRAYMLPIDHVLASVENGSLDAITLLTAISSNQNGIIRETAARLGIDARLLDLLAKNTLKAFLHAWRESFEAAVDTEAWQHSNCPFCGNLPALAEIQGIERSRYLRCLQCGARWAYPHLKCAFCSNTDYQSLGVIQLDSETHKYFAHTCDCCQRYIKTVATFEPLPAEQLPIEDLATLHLDTLAIEKGYR